MNSGEDILFKKALFTNSKDLLKKIPKSDLHNHAGLGYKLSKLENRLAHPVTPPPIKMFSLKEMDDWIEKNLSKHYQRKECFEFAVAAALDEAVEDGVKLLEMSIDVDFISHYDGNPEKFSRFVLKEQKRVADYLAFRPEIGLSRDQPPDVVIPVVIECIETGAFRSLDLYGTEEREPPEKYVRLFIKAKDLGLKCKVHVGEFGSAESLTKTVKLLHPNAIQHGISAASSKQAMKLLAEEQITLNICPASNIKLSLAGSYENHPIRVLFDNGVTVTINSDDIMVFDQTVSDEYLNLFNSGLMSAEELNTIRLQGLAQ